MKSDNSFYFIKLIICVVIGTFFTPTHSVSSQDGEKVHQSILKYWYYRDRLRYFVVPGDKPGESIIAGIRNEIGPNPKSIGYGQHGVYMGYYLGVLATEYKLLSDNNQNTDITKRDLYYVLNAYINQMDLCEQQFYSLPNIFDGFFIRYYVPNSFFIDNLSQLNEGADKAGLVWNGNYVGARPGHPWEIEKSPSSVPPEEMSQDEAIGVLLGLALVSKYLPDEFINVYKNDGSKITFNFKGAALTIADKIVRHIHDGGWYVRNPKGKMVKDGYDASVYSYGFAAAVAKMFGLSESTWIEDEGWYKTQWNTLGEVHTKSGNDWMILTLASIGDSWHIFGINKTGHRIQKLAGRDDYQWDSFYLLLWAALNDKSNNSYVVDVLPEALSIINSAPCEGPYNYQAIYADGGWASSYRWHKEVYEQYGSTEEYGSWFCGNYNGLDFMLLTNLYLIISDNNLKSSYYNYLNRHIGGDWPKQSQSNFFDHWGSGKRPLYTISLKNLSSNAKLNNHINIINHNPSWNDSSTINIPAYVTFKAKNTIILEPGFKVELGAYFNAVISDVICEDFMKTN